MKPVHRHVSRFWSEERGLTVFLVLLIVEIFFIAPLQLTGFAIRFANSVIFTLLLFSGLLAMTRKTLLRTVLSMVVGLAVAIRWTHLVLEVPGLAVQDGLAMLVCSIGFLVIVLWQVYREGPITAHRIQGAVAAYLLLSVIFAVTYSLLEHLRPASFHLSSTLEAFDGRVNRSFYYFSVVTLTTTGYGDITPVTPMARTFVMMEALIGQLYPAILIARLVSLHVETKREKKRGA